MKYTKKTHQAVGILRDRGQLTIPDSMRNSVPWMYPGSAVSMSWSDEKLVIQPPKKVTDWKKIHELRAKLSKVKSASTISTAEFIRRDRMSH